MGSGVRVGVTFSGKVVEVGEILRDRTGLPSYLRCRRGLT